METKVDIRFTGNRETLVKILLAMHVIPDKINLLKFYPCREQIGNFSVYLSQILSGPKVGAIMSGKNILNRP